MRKSYSQLKYYETVIKSVSFKVHVLERLQKLADKEGISFSKLVNLLCQKAIMKDVDFYKEMAKYHCMKMHEYQYMEKRAKELKGK